MQERSSKMCLTQFRAGTWPPVSQFKGEISNQLAADSITKWVTVSTLFFSSLPISTLKNFWTNVSPNVSPPFKSVAALISLYSTRHNSICRAQLLCVNWVLRHKVTSYFHNFILAFLMPKRLSRDFLYYQRPQHYIAFWDTTESHLESWTSAEYRYLSL